MKQTRGPMSRWLFCGTVVVLLGWLAVCPTSMEAQSPGNNAVYNSSTTLTGSPAYIDASVFFDSDICKTINDVLTGATGFTFPATGAIVDARGILPNMLSGSQPCGVDPFSGFTSGVPATVLLPASTIALSSPITSGWTLPSNVRLVGDGPDTTIIRDTVGVGNILIMGSLFSCPNVFTGISIENLTVDGDTHGANGIVNDCAQDNSYVANVWLLNIGATNPSQGTPTTGLTIAAPNSGPYSNIYFLASEQCTLSSTKCDNVGTDGKCEIARNSVES
jgi:hypothetical protein